MIIQEGAKPSRGCYTVRHGGTESPGDRICCHTLLANAIRMLISKQLLLFQGTHGAYRYIFFLQKDRLLKLCIRSEIMWQPIIFAFTIGAMAQSNHSQDHRGALLLFLISALGSFQGRQSVLKDGAYHLRHGVRARFTAPRKSFRT